MLNRWPLLERELERQARAPKILVARVVFPVLVGLAIFANTPRTAAPYFFDDFARTIASAAWWIQILVTLGYIPAVTAGLIAREREERTLPILVLAVSRPADILLAKLAPPLLHALYLLLSIMPIIGVAAILGGIDVVASAVAFAAAILVTLAIAALAVFISSTTTSNVTALIRLYLFLILWCLLAILWNIYASTGFTAGRWHPFALSFAAQHDDLVGIQAMMPLWGALAVAAAACFAATAWRLPRLAVERSVRPPWRRRSRPARRDLARMIQCASGGPGSTGGLARVITALLLTAATMLTCPLGLIILSVIMMSDVITTVRRLRDTGMLDELRLTHAPDQFLPRLYKAVLKRARVYFVPMVGTTCLVPFFPVIAWGFESHALAALALLGGVLGCGWIHWRMLASLACLLSTLTDSMPRQLINGAIILLVVHGIAVLCAGTLFFSAVENSSLVLVSLAVASWALTIWYANYLFQHAFMNDFDAEPTHLDLIGSKQPPTKLA